MFAKKQISVFLITLTAVSSAWSAQVWQSTFNTTADGVVDVKNNDSTTVMIGPVTNGRLQITTKDKSNAFNQNDRAGRPLGATLSGNNSFSALYKFNWSSLPQSTSATYEGFGFIGSDTCGVVSSNTVCSSCAGSVCNITKQVLGGLLQHRRDGTGENFVKLGIQFGESGAGNPFNKIGAEVDIGSDAVATTSDFYFALGYDGTSHVESLALYDVNGSLLATVSADLDASTGGLLPTGANTVQMMLDNLQMTHLGWNDYVGAGNNLTTVWQVDTLTYFSDARGAFDAVPNQVFQACCLPAGTCDEGNSSQGCQARGGSAGNATCVLTTCPPPVGACCHPDGSCSQETSAACAAISGTWHGANSACTLTTCPQPPIGACCSSLDGSCSDGKTQFNCVGTWQGANTTCAQTTCPPPPPGACCLSNGACISVSSGQCALQCGTFSGAGSTCASANCAQVALGACCLSNGTCSMTHEYDCSGAFHGPGSDCGSANCQPMPSLVWWSNFATGNDGVVDVKDNNPTKVLIGPQCNGQLRIQNRASASNFENTDRGGRSVGTTLTGNNSFSGLYRFRWSDLSESESQNNELVTFVGNASNSTQQVLGMMVTHNKTAAGDYFVRMCSAGGESANYFLFQCGAAFNLGPDAETRNFQIAISYDGPSHLLTHSILDDQGNLLGTVPTQSFQVWDLDTNCPSTTFCPDSTTDGVGCQNYFDCAVPCPTCTKQTRYNALALTHLGWSDYASLSGTTQDTIWQMDSLAYFNDAGGAYNAVYGLVPRGACCRANGSCGDNDSELACKAAAGSWSGAGTTCATTVCAGACCLPDGSCLANQTLSACLALSGTFRGLNTACPGPTDPPCPLPPCHTPFADADNDGDVDQDDFGRFQRCFTGPFQTLTQLGLLGYCHCFDRDHNDTVDGSDLVVFQGCESGAGIPADPGCAP